MKLYVHKHIALDVDTWQIIDNFMKEKNINNFTNFIKDVIMEKINIKNNWFLYLHFNLKTRLAQ